VPGQRPVGPQQGEAAHGGSGSAPANRPVRAAGLVVYAALLVGTAVACLVGAVGSYRAATAPCPDTDTTCESFGIVGAVVLVATAASGGLLAAFLRQESRVAVWLTLVLGGISVLCLTFLGVAACGVISRERRPLVPIRSYDGRGGARGPRCVS
jgi:hypothetical protein